MNEEFIEYLERELKLLYEDARDFAADHPGIVDRLGDLSRDKIDPGIARLLEGSAFMAARIQLKLKSEFSEFTIALLDQLVPNYLAPVPSCALVAAEPAYDDPKLAGGMHFERGAYLDATFIERERRVQCRYRLTSDLTLYPLRLEAASYMASPAPLQSLGLETMPGTVSGLRLTIMRPTRADAEDDAGAPLAEVEADTLPVHLLGNPGDVNQVYELIFARRLRLSVRYLDGFGNPVFIPLAPDQIEQIGFDLDPLYPVDNRSFSGFDLLRDFYVFPHKYAGFRIKGLRSILRRLPGTSFELVFEFDQVRPKLAATLGRENFALHAVAVTNLFEHECSRVPVATTEHEHHIVPDRSRWMELEIHRVLDVGAHLVETGEKVPVYPLYVLPDGGERLTDTLHYSVRRLPRRLTARERRGAGKNRYLGSDMFISLYEPAGRAESQRVRELSVRALVSNRHLPDDLPVGTSGPDFLMTDDTSVPLKVLAGPTKVRESPVIAQRKSADGPPNGRTMWQLVNILALNHLGLTDRGAKKGAAGLRELLALFGNLSDAVTERQLRGIEAIETRPVVRRIAQPDGYNAARGLEITITFDETAFEGSGVMLLGAVLDRFLAEYSAINSFTQTVIKSVQRGVVMRWPARTGLGGLL